MAILFAPPRFKATDLTNAPISGAFLQFCQYLTSTPQPIYTDSTLATTLSNPVRADANGLFPEIWLDDSLPPYKVIFFSPDTNNPTVPGSIIWTLQLYNPAIPLIHPVTAEETAAAVTIQNFYYRPLDVRRYGWVNDSTWSGSPRVYSGTNNYAALISALKVASQSGASGSGATIRIPGGGTNLALLQGSSTIAWPDNVGIEIDQNVNLIWNDNGTGAFCLTNGAAGARHGNIFSKNLTIILATATACGLRLYNTVGGTYLNTYIEGYSGNYTTRTNIGLQIEATPSTGACWFNDFYGINLNHCHLGMLLPASSGGYVTQNTFRNFRYYGDSNMGDTTSVAIFAQAGSYCLIDGFWIEAVGAYGLDFQGVGGWSIDNGAFDSGEGQFTAVYFDPNTSNCRVGKNVTFGYGAWIQNAAPASAGNVIEAAQGPWNGRGFAISHQAAVGLNDGQGYINSFFSPQSGGLVISNVSQAIQGACYNPLDNQIYLVSKQGNLIAYSPALGQATNYIAYSTNVSDTDPLYTCFCPVNNRIYVAARQDNSVVVIDPRTWTVVQTLSLTATAGSNCHPYQIAYCPFNQKIYVANQGTSNLSVITPTGNGSDSVAQTLSGFGVGLLAVAYCPITQRMYAGGNSTSVFVVTPTTNATDSIAQTIATTLGTGCYALAFCPKNQKMYAVSSGSTKIVSLNPTTNGTDSVLTSFTLVANGNSASGTRGICWDEAAQAMLCIGSGNWLASVSPSLSGSADICTQVQATMGGTSLQICYHPGFGKAYEINTSLSYIPEWS